MEEERLVETLKATKLFGGMRRSELLALVRACKVLEVERGEPIDNDSGVEYFNIVVEGGVKLMHTDPVTGRSVVIFLLKSGDVFDILSFLDGEGHHCNPVAVDAVTLLRMPMASARAWIERSEAWNERFLPYIGEQMRTLERFAESVVFDDTATRLARLILRHADPNAKNAEGDYPVRLVNNLSHELLAEMIGSVRSVVTTQLQKLKKEELILQRRGYLAIRKLEELKTRYGL